MKYNKVEMMEKRIAQMFDLRIEEVERISMGFDGFEGYYFRGPKTAKTPIIISDLTDVILDLRDNILLGDAKNTLVIVITGIKEPFLKTCKYLKPKRSLKINSNGFVAERGSKIFEPGDCSITKIGKCLEDPVSIRGTIIGNFKKEFILIKSNSGLILVDQHAAHERVRLEMFMNQILTGTDLSERKIKLELDISTLVRIHVYSKDKETLILPTIMTELSEDDLVISLKEMANPLFSGQIGDILMDLLKMKACRGAIMFGDTLTQTEMEDLIDQLCKCKYPTICAHGRPSIKFLALD